MKKYFKEHPKIKIRFDLLKFYIPKSKLEIQLAHTQNFQYVNSSLLVCFQTHAQMISYFEPINDHTIELDLL